MLFNSFSFLIFFLILVVLYYFIPHKFRWILLILASYYFYSTFNVGYILLLFVCTLTIYITGRGIQHSPNASRKKHILIIGVVASLLPLFVFKYVAFFADSLNGLFAFGQETSPTLIPRLNLLLPAGLSFFTFSCLSYLFDVYRGKLLAETHLGHLALYISFFPKLLAGPIERATAFLTQILKPVRFDPEQVTLGLRQMLWGLFKKLVIADRLATFVDTAYRNPDFASPVALLIATYFFAFQIYCDFSGYSDIAIGTARVLGFDLMENFRRAYLARSAPEFWGKDRWHISLNCWFRDYMYIPMGGSKVSTPRFFFNLMAVFVVSGLWHGANWTFVIWGALNGFYQIVSLAIASIVQKIISFARVPSAVISVLGGLITFHLILIAWVFFRAVSVSDALTVFSRIWNAAPRFPNLLAAYNYTDEIVLSIILIGVLLVLEVFDEWRNFWSQLHTRPVYVRWAIYYALIFALVIFGKWGLKQFVYMQF